MTDKAQVQHQISPGMCPPEGCPPPDRIECIVVDKVYDSCFQIDNRSRNFEFNASGGNVPSVGDVVPCQQYGDITCEEINRSPVPGQPGFFTVTLLVKVPLRLKNPANPMQTAERELTFIKTVTLCCPQEARVDCTESTVLFCNCIVTEVENGATKEVTVTCDIQVCIVIKCILTVQLLVPSYGFCVPAPCITLPGVCPPLPPAQCF